MVSVSTFILRFTVDMDNGQGAHSRSFDWVIFPRCVNRTGFGLGPGSFVSLELVVTSRNEAVTTKQEPTDRELTSVAGFLYGFGQYTHTGNTIAVIQFLNQNSSGGATLGSYFRYLLSHHDSFFCCD